MDVIRVMAEGSGGKIRRVACLYRVSTKRQTEDNDIPMQKNACRSFIAQREGWVLTREYTETGVSGYHKSAEQRDAVKQARHDAEQGLFDILLVFMFDRLGRREDETPFVVEWFTARGVAVWSVTEGQQRFDNRVDKLLNYIRFWQSGGESEKTSIRVKEKHRQMVEEGQYRGGSAPYGYRLEDTGRKNKKGYALKQLVIDETERPVVQTIFRLVVEQGYGGRRIAGYLNERGILTQKGNPWTPVSVMDLLKNPIYMGQYVSGRRKNLRDGSKRVPQEQWTYAREIKPEWAIIAESVWKKAEAVRLSRTKDIKKETAKAAEFTIPRQTHGLLLLTGLLTCGYCGSVMVSRYAVRHWKHKTGGGQTTSRRLAYRCPGNKGIVCRGQHTYTQKRVDPLVLPVLNIFLNRLPRLDITEQALSMVKEDIKQNELILSRLKNELTRAENDIERLEQEIMSSLRGDSPFTEEQLAHILRDREEAADKLRKKLTHMEERQTRRRTRGEINETLETADLWVLKDWLAVFDSAPVSAQKMIVGFVLRRVVITGEAIKIYTYFTVFADGKGAVSCLKPT